MRTISILAVLGGILGVVAAQVSCYTTSCEDTKTCPIPFSADESDAQPPTSYMVSTLAGAGDAGAADGPGSSATFSNPIGIAIGPDGSLYVSDYFNDVIRKIAGDGMVSTYAGTGNPGVTNGDCATATFGGPIGIAVDAAGTVYVADDSYNLIRQITPATCQVSSLAGQGTISSGNSDGTGSAAKFYFPEGLTLDASGNIYVADSWNNKFFAATC